MSQRKTKSLLPMSAMQTAMGAQYEVTDTEFKTTYADFGAAKTTSLTGVLATPYREGHILIFDRWVYVVPKRRDGTNSTVKTVMVFKDKSNNNREVQIWLSYFSKEWRAVEVPAADSNLNKTNPEFWKTTANGLFGGQMGEAARNVLISSMTNDEIMAAMEAIVKPNGTPIEWVVKRHKYTHATQDRNGRLHVGPAEYVHFDKVAP